MLRRGDGRVCTPSLTSYLDAPPGEQPRRGDPKIFLRIAVQEPDLRMLAMVDTGATYSVLDANLANVIGAFEDADAPEVSLSTRFGQMNGRLVRRQAWILCTEGSAFRLEATFWVCPEWRFGPVLGYSGLLDRLRFAIDPGRNHFHFGPLED